jgi:hypothetical protein
MPGRRLWFQWPFGQSLTRAAGRKQGGGAVLSGAAALPEPTPGRCIPNSSQARNFLAASMVQIPNLRRRNRGRAEGNSDED